MTNAEQKQQLEAVAKTTTSYNMRRLANVALALLERVEQLEAKAGGK